MMLLRLVGVVVLGLSAAGIAAHCEDAAPPEPEHYRNEDYRAPTPTTLGGARVIATAQAEALWRAGTAAFVDVMPHVQRPADLPAGTIWRGKPRRNIPGSVWLADTGYGELAASTADYFKAGLERITGGDRSKVSAIAGCRGTPPSARLLWAMRRSPGIPTAPTAGRRLDSR